ncbi:MAG: polysaccharide pyruvyl transferase family protein [Patescibacteria group bacterium]
MKKSLSRQLNGRAFKKEPLKIAHLHVWDKKNKGDVAIVLAVQELLNKKFPGCQINDFPVSLLKNVGVMAKGAIADRQLMIKKINQADLVVIGGGGIFYSYFLPFNRDVVEAIKRPIVLFGVGYIREVDAPKLSREAARSVVALVKKAKAVGVRDNNTKRFLVKNGVSAKKIEVIGDPAALLTEKKPKIATLRKLGLARPNKKIKIGLNLNYSGWLGFGKWQEDILKAYQEAAEYFLKKYGGSGGSGREADKTGAQFYYLKHHPGENKIYPELKIKDLRVVDLRPAEQKYVYGQMDLVIGMMLHAGVLAFGAEAPEISVAYDLRNYSFAEFIGCPELVVDLDKLKKGELLRRAKLVFKEKRIYRRKFILKDQEIFQKQAKFIRKINSVI